MKKDHGHKKIADSAKYGFRTLFHLGVHRDEEYREFLDMLNNCQRTIIQVCLRFTDRQPDSIRDLYQEIVTTLWEAWPGFQHRSSVNTWVRRIALNVSVTEIRRQIKQPCFVPIEDWACEKVAEEDPLVPYDYDHLISQLEPEERALLFLRLDGLPLIDIAERLGTTEAAVKQRLYRIRKKSTNSSILNLKMNRRKIDKSSVRKPNNVSPDSGMVG